MCYCVNFVAGDECHSTWGLCCVLLLLRAGPCCPPGVVLRAGGLDVVTLQSRLPRWCLDSCCTAYFALHTCAAVWPPPCCWEPCSEAGVVLLLPRRTLSEPLHCSCLQVGDGDFFWEQHGRDQFPKAAADSDLELNKYKTVSAATASSAPLGVCVSWLLRALGLMLSCTIQRQLPAWDSQSGIVPGQPFLPTPATCAGFEWALFLTGYVHLSKSRIWPALRSCSCKRLRTCIARWASSLLM